MMTTEQKLEQIADKLLVKTQDNLCDWKKIAQCEFSLSLPGFSDIFIYKNTYDNVILTIKRGQTILASLSTAANTENSLSRLYLCVKAYQETYVVGQLDKLGKELDKLGD